MHVLRLSRHLPSWTLAPLALPLDTARRARIDGLLAAQPLVADLVTEALTRLQTDPADALAARTVDRYVLMMLQELRAPHGTWSQRASARLDALVRTGLGELMDQDWTPGWVKRAEMALLDRVNHNLDSYRRWAPEVAAAVHGIEAPHVLDLAAGSGGFSRFLAAQQRAGLTQRPDLHLTSTDLEPAFVETGRRLAVAARLPVAFAVRDALDLQDLHGTVDLFVCTQSTHHMPPGMLVRLIHGAVRAARRGILIVDLMRSALNVAGAAVVTHLTAPFPPLVVDGMQSIRRSYTPAELALLARLAGAGQVSVRVMQPAFAILHATA